MPSTYRMPGTQSKPQIRAFLRPSAEPPVQFMNTSSSNESKTDSYGTQDSNLSDGTTSIGSHQPKGNSSHFNGDDGSIGFRDPFTTTTESVRSVDSQRSLATVCSTNTPRYNKSTRLGASKMQSQLSKSNSESTTVGPTRRGPIIRTCDKPDTKEIIFQSLQTVRNENRKMALTMPPRTPLRTGWQLTKSKLNAEPFKVTKISKCRKEETESICSERSEIVGGCRIITTRPDDYSSTLKAIHPSNKIYQTIPEMEPKAKQKLLADFANAGIDLEKLGENIEDIGIKVSHDPITHSFKEIPVFRIQNDNIQQYLTSRYI